MNTAVSVLNILATSGMLQWLAIALLGLLHVKNGQAIVTHSSATAASLAGVLQAVSANNQAVSQVAGSVAAIAGKVATIPPANPLDALGTLGSGPGAVKTAGAV